MIASLQQTTMQEQTHLPSNNKLAAAQSDAVSAYAAVDTSRERLWIVLSLLSLYLIWGSTYFAIRIAVQSIPPLLMAGVRFLTAGVILYTILRARGAANPTRQQWKGSAIVGLFLGVGGMGGVAFAEQWVSSSVTAFCIATTPLWISLFSGLFGRWPSRTEWIGLIVGLIGVVFLNIGNNLWATPLSAVILILSPMSWAFGSALSRRLTLPVGLMDSAAQMLAGGAALVLLGLIVGERPTGILPWQALVAVAYLILVGSLIAYTAYGYLLRRVRPTLATSYAYVNPLVAVCLGVAFGGENVTPVGIVGMIVILTGVVLVSLARGKHSLH